jgi:hypothetical protein
MAKQSIHLMGVIDAICYSGQRKLRETCSFISGYSSENTSEESYVSMQFFENNQNMLQTS